MLTSFFNNTKPIHFVFVAVYMALFYCLANFVFLDTDFDLIFLIRKIIGLIAFLLTMLILNFIAKRNELTGNNSYKILLFAAFSALFIESLQNSDVVFANLFIVLGLRRVISLKSQRFSKEKIFDAVFWICVASLFYFWSIIFLAVVYFGIIIHVAQNIKNWIVPIVAFLAVLSLVTCFHLLVYDELYTYEKWYQPSFFDFTDYGNLKILIPLSLILALTVWMGTFFLASIQRASAVIKTSLILILLSLVVSGVVVFFSPVKNGSEILFFLIPLSIIVANYFDVVPDKWFKEALLIILVLLPFFLIWF